jgi:hypothetical protein
MRKISLFVLIVAMAAMSLPAQPAQALTAQQFYLVPVEQIGSTRGPEYFAWRFDDEQGSITARWAMMDYGFLNNALLLAFDMTQADHDALCAHADVYCFPDNLDTPANTTLKSYVETINLPSDWTTPSTSNRELLRKLAGIMQFNQRYGGSICPGETFLGAGGVTLDTKWNALSAAQQACFNQTISSFGVTYTVTGNPSLRTIIKRGGDIWDGVPFILGGFEF